MLNPKNTAVPEGDDVSVVVVVREEGKGSFIRRLVHYSFLLPLHCQMTLGFCPIIIIISPYVHFTWVDFIFMLLQKTVRDNKSFFFSKTS